MYIARYLLHSRGDLVTRLHGGSKILRRDDSSNQGFKDKTVTIVLVVVISCLILITLISYFLLRRLRAKGKSPRIGSSTNLRSKWQALISRKTYSQVSSRDRARELSRTNTAYNGNVTETEERAAVQAEVAGVDRNTSVRSVITLPPYSFTPKETEQIIGREGERGGMDTVVEFPETAEQEETHRDEDMEALYQIRLARRREVLEREERRRQRREARERGDWARLEELRRESRARASSTQDLTSTLNGAQSVSAASLLAEHQSRGRDRRVSEVSYGALGQVRHDGSRLRANSDDSERGELLSDAAPMGNDSSSLRSTTNPDVPGRARGLSSASSVLTASTAASESEDIRQQTPTSIHPTESNGDSGTTNSSPRANRFTPDESTGSEDIGESRMPVPSAEDSGGHHLPPHYEFIEWGDAPAYETHNGSQRTASNRLSRASNIPHLIVPQINVEGATEPNTPITPSTTGMTHDDHH